MFDNYKLVSSKEEIMDFINSNDKALEILEIMSSHLKIHFPGCELSLEVCDKLIWTTDDKLLINVNVSEEVFFNSVLYHFIEIYKNISFLIEDIFCPVVLFPCISDKNYDRFSKSSTINLVAQSAYFNNEFDDNYLREVTLRDIPKNQQIAEIMEYCRCHENPNFSDMLFDLRLDIFEADRIVDELKDSGIDLNIEY